MLETSPSRDVKELTIRLKDVRYHADTFFRCSGDFFLFVIIVSSKTTSILNLVIVNMLVNLAMLLAQISTVRKPPKNMYFVIFEM